MKSVKEIKGPCGLEAHIEGVKIGRKNYSIRIGNYQPARDSPYGALDVAFVNGKPHEMSGILPYHLVFDKKGLRVYRNADASSRSCSWTETLCKIIRPVQRGEKKGDLVWRNSQSIFLQQGDYQQFYLPFGKVKK